tara:strand:- start:495 stop:647 length:153 start_codon:yes stop_codon:yes gene_type:complete
VALLGGDVPLVFEGLAPLPRLQDRLVLGERLVEVGVEGGDSFLLGVVQVE